MKSTDIHIRVISLEMPQPSITKIPWKITHPKFYSNFPGAYELMLATILWLRVVLLGHAELNK